MDLTLKRYEEVMFTEVFTAGRRCTIRLLEEVCVKTNRRPMTFEREEEESCKCVSVQNADRSHSLGCPLNIRIKVETLCYLSCLVFSFSGLVLVIDANYKNFCYKIVQKQDVTNPFRTTAFLFSLFYIEAQVIVIIFILFLYSPIKRQKPPHQDEGKTPIKEQRITCSQSRTLFPGTRLGSVSELGEF